MAREPSTPTIREARAASGTEVAPAPQPTSRTVPPSGSASRARRAVGEGSSARTASALRRNGSAGNP